MLLDLKFWLIGLTILLCLGCFYFSPTVFRETEIANVQHVDHILAQCVPHASPHVVFVVPELAYLDSLILTSDLDHS